MSTSLAAAIEDAINAFCSENGYGIPLGFVYCVERIDEDGDRVLTIGSQEKQTSWQSMGLSRYLTKWIEDDVDQEIARVYTFMEDEDD